MALDNLGRVEKNLSPQQERVAELIAAGCTPNQVASATGFSLGYISQLGKLVEFKEKLVEKSGARVVKDIKKQDAYDGLESVLLMGIKERASLADMSELSRALDVVAKNNPKRGNLGGTGEGGNGSANVSVTVNLPAHVLAPLNIEVNARNEVVKMAGKPMLPLTAQAIRTKLQDIES